MGDTLLKDASFTELMYAASKRLGRDEALVLIDLCEDDPSSRDAWAIIGNDSMTIPREAIKAHGRR